MHELKRGLKGRARLLRGLTNVLQVDADYIWSDANNHEVLCLNESIKEAKTTLQQINDCVTELEYMLYLLKHDESQ
jgi:hypothetical protein